MSGMTLGLVCFSGVVFALACILAIWEQVRSLDSIDRYPNRSIPLTEEELYEHEQEMIELARIAEEERLAKENGLVVVFGYSDDNIELRGAINNEAGCFDGGSFSSSYPN